MALPSFLVAPHAGAWIETMLTTTARSRISVAPHAGAWIETALVSPGEAARLVAPHAGAWIETFSLSNHREPVGRAPRGRVD